MKAKILGSFVGMIVAVGAYDGGHRAEAQDGPAAAITYASKKPADPGADARARAEEESRRFAYRGLTVRPDPRPEGPTAEVQRELIDLLTWDDDVPEARKAQFRWVHELGGEITGWRGEVVSLLPADRGHIATLKVYAQQTTGAAVINGEVYERCRIVDGRLEFLDSYTDGLPKVTTFN